MRLDFSHTRIIIRPGTTNMLASEEQQQSLQQKDDEIAERDLKINAQIAVIKQKNKQIEAEKSEKEHIKLELIKVQESIATSELLAYTMTNKFCEHLPFYRQEKAFEQRCITVTRADMSNWQEQIYKRLKPMDKLIMNHVACLAHVRRKFFDASLNGKTPGASRAVKYIQQIYRLEELISKRKELIKPVFDEFHEWLLEIKPKVPPTLMFGRQ